MNKKNFGLNYLFVDDIGFNKKLIDKVRGEKVNQVEHRKRKSKRVKKK